MTTNLISINVPYAKRHILPELRINGGKFDSDTKTWILPESPEARTLKELVERRLAGASQKERINNILKLAVDLLNAVNYRKYQISEVDSRIVLESRDLKSKSVPTAAESAPFVAARTPPSAVTAPPVASTMPSVVDTTMLAS